MGGYQPDRFEHITVRRPVYMLDTWPRKMKGHKGHECRVKRPWKEHDRKKRNERSMKENEYNMQSKRKEHESKMKGTLQGRNGICWLSTKDAFTPTESWRNHISVQRALPEKTIRVFKKRQHDFRAYKKTTGFDTIPHWRLHPDQLLAYL